MPQLDPNTFTPQLFWFVITFVLLYLAMWRIIIPSIGEILQNRQIRIDNDLQKAEQLKKEAEIVRETYEKLISDGRQAAQDTVRSATEKMQLEVAEKHEALTEKLMSQAEKAEDQINSVKNKALDEIQLIAVEITQVAATRLIDKTISEVEAKSAVSSVIEERKNS
ncbi:MAG: F0F1 ATP synthase subunit B' [Rhodospirillaceae bacterium]|jgi:F-type H+-transporting ATPase subunit b|nr:F0F1 ATP synthase subunit B' [Rhodospirillaceae bacterium]